MRVSEGISVSLYELNVNFLKMRVIEIRVKRIRVNQGLDVCKRASIKLSQCACHILLTTGLI